MAEDRSFLIGLIGNNLAASRSPEVHEREARALGRTLVYRPIDFAALGLGVADLDQVIVGLERAGFNGFNVTYPFKQAILPHLHRVSEDGLNLGAVNTVVFRDGERCGTNTDWVGFLGLLERGFVDVSKDWVLQLGAGGAGAAAAYALLKWGVGRLDIADIDQDRAARLASAMQARFPKQIVETCASPETAIADVQGVVNATPIGMTGHLGSPINVDLLGAKQWVADVIYHPSETVLLAAAARLGLTRSNGGPMMILQAAEAFRAFTGLQPNVDRMLAQTEDSRIC